MKKIIKRSFASDNNSGVHADVLAAITEANSGHYVSYGDDDYTMECNLLFKKMFGETARGFLVCTGTGANTTVLKSISYSYNSIICTDSAHIHVDECGAVENFTGSKLQTIASSDGKLTPQLIAGQLHGIGDEHHSQPSVISITQSTELGTVYTCNEIKALADYAHASSMLLHVDGARLANAAVSLGCSFREMISDTGVDVLSLGGTKNGMMMGEAVIFLKSDLAKHYRYYRKQGMQLLSKMRFTACQFLAMFGTDLWEKNAYHANKMALVLNEKLLTMGINVLRKSEVNSVFVTLPPAVIPVLQADFFFYVWNEHLHEVRFMTSFDTTIDDVNQFIECLKKVLRKS